MARRPRIAIVGAGNFGSALAEALFHARYAIAIVSRSRSSSLKKARKVAAEVGALATTGLPVEFRADVVWFTVPDAEIARVAQALAGCLDWGKKVALHSSGALTNDVLDVLRRRGAAIASLHPLMTFVPGSRASLAGVPFAIEGDAAALRVGRRIVRDIGGQAYPIRKKDKAAYHAWGTFASPLLDALLATAEHVAAVAGVSPKEAKRRMLPILRQTLANYAASGAAEAFSGPIARGDVDTVKRHLKVLQDLPEALEAYSALAKAALRYLPSKKRGTSSDSWNGKNDFTAEFPNLRSALDLPVIPATS